MRRAGGARGDRRRRARSALIMLAAATLILAAMYAVSRGIETGARRQNVRGDLSAVIKEAGRITYEGAVYEPKNLTTVLVMGIDRDASAGGGARNGGQADFIMLLLIDPVEKTVLPLQIDRDTMTRITVLGVMGNESGTRNAQICLSHGFGDGNAQSCLLTQKAVSDLLPGIEIDNYVAMNLDGIRVLNDMVGGVTVKLDDDFSALDPAMKKGATLTLQGEQAEIFVRTRWNIGVGTNEARMERQSAFLQAVREKLDAKCRGDRDFPGELYDALKPYLETDMRRGRIINEVWRTRDYSYAGVVRPTGQHSVGENGFMEFHADSDALRALVVDLFYQPAQPGDRRF